MCYMGRADVRYMPCTAVCLPNLCAHRVSVNPSRPKAKKAAIFCLVNLVGRGLNCRVHGLGLAKTMSDMTETLIYKLRWFWLVALGGLFVTAP
jgi:hypothetical protein